MNAIPKHLFGAMDVFFDKRHQSLAAAGKVGHPGCYLEDFPFLIDGMSLDFINGFYPFFISTTGEKSSFTIFFQRFIVFQDFYIVKNKIPFFEKRFQLLDGKLFDVENLFMISCKVATSLAVDKN